MLIPNDVKNSILHILNIKRKRVIVVVILYSANVLKLRLKNKNIGFFILYL